ncbi:MAG: hypothetical protein K2L45_06615 [Muribaculaceae bacterium]|nr:hypothetical protein [Muribaculaceae bacterium]
MKKQLIFYILSLIFIASLPAVAANKAEGNPINIAVSLTQKEDTTSMASTCEYYGYVRQQPQDGYTVYTHPNGSKIRYKYSDADLRNSNIEVTTKSTAKEKDNILTELRFEKNGNVYERKYTGFIVRCTNGPRNSLILTTQRTHRP